MSESTHTSGPWVWGNCLEEVIPGAVDCCELVAYGPPDRNGSCPIDTVLELADDFSISRSNACLIYAAPELLAALRRVLTVGNKPDLSAKENRDALDEAIADGWRVISKAEGRS